MFKKSKKIEADDVAVEATICSNSFTCSQLTLRDDGLTGKALKYLKSHKREGGNVWDSIVQGLAQGDGIQLYYLGSIS